MKSIPAFIVDAFTNKPFGGNPAAICILAKEKSEQWMQAVAAEFNLSETAFLVQREKDLWDLRWFTPTKEVNLCGHATLAATHVLANELLIPQNIYRFATKSGELRASSINDGFQLDFPRVATQQIAAENLEGLIGSEHCGVFTAGEDLIMVLATEEDVLNYHPNHAAIRQLLCRGLIVTAPSQGDTDFVSRFFAPAYGIDEDPVTGSAHCSLGDYWSKKLGKSHLVARQVSKRGGELILDILEDRVLISGNAVTTLKAKLVDS